MAHCDKLLIAWRVSEFWHIPVIYNKKVSEELNTNSTIGWTVKNISDVEMAKALCNECIELPFAQIKIFHNGSNPISKTAMFMFEVFLRALQNIHVNNATEQKQTQLIDFLSRTTKETLGDILQHSALLTTEQEIIRSDVIKLSNGIFDYVDICRLELNKLHIHKTLFNLRELIDDVIEMATGATKNAETKNTTVQILYYVENLVPEFIYSDEARLKQILMTLLRNAVRATIKGEIILYVTSDVIYLSQEDESDDIDYLRAADHQYNITFTVKDTGVGLSTDVQNNIFKNYDEHIDLHVAHMLAQCIDGNLCLVSSNSAGSCFKLEIIAINTEPAEVEKWTLRELKGKRVLVVTESPMIDLVDFLDKYAMCYVMASSEEEIRALHCDKKYDLLICGNSKFKDIDRLFMISPKMCIVDTTDATTYKGKILTSLMC